MLIRIIQELILIFYLCIPPFLKKVFGCLVVAHGNFSCSMWDLVPQAGIELDPWHWERRVLATGPPGKSLWIPSHLWGE